VRRERKRTRVRGEKEAMGNERLKAKKGGGPKEYKKLEGEKKKGRKVAYYRKSKNDAEKPRGGQNRGYETEVVTRKSG